MSESTVLPPDNRPPRNTAGRGLQQLLANSVDHESAAPLPRELLTYAVLAAIWTLLFGLGTLLLISIAPAVPVVFIGVGIGLLVSAFLLQDATGSVARRWATTHFAIGAIAPVLTLVLVVLAAIAVVLYIALACLALAMIAGLCWAIADSY